MSLYQEIAKHLRQKIEDGNYQPGEALPRQTDLASEYNTSRVTIQKALDMLFNDNLIIRKQGSGTFVSPTYSSALDIISSQYGGTTQLFSGKADVSTQVLHFEIRLPTNEESKQLNISTTVPVYDIYRLRKLDQEPYELTKSIMPLSVISNLTQEVAEHSIFSFIQNDLKMAIGSAVRRISADKATDDDIKYLDCLKEDPILQITQTVSLKDGRIFEYSHTRHRYDKGSIVVFNKVPLS
ncbi:MULTISPECIES: GntR family transcriptional regulator [Leuconostoc]|uniref:Transcriptional regulator, GntR family n=2 Tax=Leuconostoc TaxID=1243 RepID=A0AAN2QVU1_9LACO|nr:MULTISPECIES: GntR family transcriptional regulator [Leuconostoc]MBZ5944241.1 GntR family transcriptional regulator [Leuconostoc gasicomitatum]MBZ5945534.1 GntR family transcriptional regulator [Leuconostoc gasicomitatum]MBZ5946903.1 GntR family transcriptional regulator [Leuconostoc gasicomitatum]MBZ5948911.1 GntR family transcriptional regulator [Leuconostoc gasicomitatum]MBZ5951390.1 GntR family transcriptional regulator [Leuconostoc gasicomitatum]